MGAADYYASGQWNVRCQECARKIKSSQARKRWEGWWVCWTCWEIRNPQDYVRGIPDRQTPPWTTGDPPPIFIDNTGSQPAIGTQDYSMVLDAYFLGSTFLG